MPADRLLRGSEGRDGGDPTARRRLDEELDGGRQSHACFGVHAAEGEAATGVGDDDARSVRHRGGERTGMPGERVAAAREAKGKAAALLDEHDGAVEDRRGSGDGVRGFRAGATKVGASDEERVTGRGVRPRTDAEAAGSATRVRAACWPNRRRVRCAAGGPASWAMSAARASKRVSVTGLA